MNNALKLSRPLPLNLVYPFHNELKLRFFHFLLNEEAELKLEENQFSSRNVQKQQQEICSTKCTDTAMNSKGEEKDEKIHGILSSFPSSSTFLIIQTPKSNMIDEGRA